MKKIITLTALTSLMLLASCSTMTFIPTDGAASKFNLATVEYVRAQNIAQQEELLTSLSENIRSQLDSLLAEDRQRLNDLAQLLDSLNASLDVMAARIDTSEMNLDRSLSGMSKELTTVKTNASSTRMVIRRINDSIDTLPLKSLETFNAAINEYLKKNTTEPVTE